MPDAGSDENVAAFANRTNDDAVLEKTDSEENEKILKEKIPKEKMPERIAKTKAKVERA